MGDQRETQDFSLKILLSSLSLFSLVTLILHHLFQIHTLTSFAQWRIRFWTVAVANSKTWGANFLNFSPMWRSFEFSMIWGSFYHVILLNLVVYSRIDCWTLRGNSFAWFLFLRMMNLWLLCHLISLLILCSFNFSIYLAV